MTSISQNKAQATLLGFALGDAYGRSLEFLSGIRVRTQKVPIDSSNFMWTDDTHMSLYVASAVLSLSRFNIDAFGNALGKELTKWLHDPKTTTLSPSNTCLRGMRNYLYTKDWRRSGLPNSDGCGAIVRVSPIALAYASPQLEQAAEISAMITHGHPNAIAGAVSTARLLRKALTHSRIDANMVLEEANLIEKEYPRATSLPAALRGAVQQASRQQIDWLDEAAIPDGDGGWKSPSALGLALTAVLHFGNNFQVAIDKAARINGDSDSVAALTGMFIGAVKGMEGLPLNWLQFLPNAKEIAQQAIQLTKISTPTDHLESSLRVMQDQGARFEWFHQNLVVKVPQNSTKGILSLRSIAADLGLQLQVEGNAVSIAIPPEHIPASFSNERDVRMGNAMAEEHLYEEPISEAEVIVEEEEEEIIDVEVIEEENPFVEPPPSPSTPVQNPFTTQKTSSSTRKGDLENEYETSQTSPIRFDWVESAPCTGKLGLTFAPGKHGSGMYTEKTWKRDLETDLDRLRAFYQVDALFSHIENVELETLGIQNLVEEAEKRRIAIFRMPIVDTKTPSIPLALEGVRTATTLLRAGYNVVFHCRGGLGRAGTMAACTLIGLGFDAKKAIREVRQSRKGAIENIFQETFVLEFPSKWRLK
ncbi:MAG: ADP-ribosylglycohydrolase family protein [Myxococcota bacterium]|nr:ADP-ribosylglycohydrolase family protein [Myxococcota bacterium]